MSKPSDMPYEERKRQYAALRRAIHRDASPALLAKFSLANDGERFLGVDFWEFQIKHHGLIFTYWMSPGCFGDEAKNYICFPYGHMVLYH